MAPADPTAMTGALPYEEEIFVDIGYDSGSDIGSDYETPWSNYWNPGRKPKGCCQIEIPLPEVLQEDQVYDEVYPSPPISPVTSSSSRFDSLRGHSRKFSETSLGRQISESSLGRHSRKISNHLSIFQRRRGSSKTVLNVDVPSAISKFLPHGQAHTCPVQEDFHCGCFLGRYVKGSSAGRSIKIPSDVSPAVTELEELAREQLVKAMRKQLLPRLESEVSPKIDRGIEGRIERRRLALQVKEEYAEQKIDARYINYIETQRRDAKTVQEGFKAWANRRPYAYEECTLRAEASGLGLFRRRSLGSMDLRVGPTDSKRVPINLV